MGLKDILPKKKNESAQDTNTQNMSTLAEDIPKAAEWVARALNTSGYKADYSLESIREIDRFFDEQSGPDGILQNNGTGQILFSLGS